MPTQTALPNDSPEMKAWERYKASERYANSLHWLKQQHYEGSTWAIFDEGWQAAMQTPTDADKELEELRAQLQSPANTVEVKAGQVLSRDERDGLGAANAWLAMLQDMANDVETKRRIQRTIAVIFDILHE